MWYERVVSESPKTKEALSETYSWVDVRDTALGHVLALEKDAAGDQRIITASGERHVNLIYRVILILILQGVLIGKNGVCLHIRPLNICN